MELLYNTYMNQRTLYVYVGGSTLYPILYVYVLKGFILSYKLKLFIMCYIFMKECILFSCVMFML